MDGSSFNDSLEIGFIRQPSGVTREMNVSENYKPNRLAKGHRWVC